MRDPIARQEPNAVNFQHECLKQRQREETEMLVFHRESREPILSVCLRFRKSEQRYIDVRVGGNVVRRGMMEIVFVKPPTVAKSE